MYMKKLLLCIMMLMSIHLLQGQNIVGTVKDQADGSPVPYATAALLRSDSSAVTGVITGDDGKFVLANIAAGDYLLQVSFIGYEREYRSVNVPTQSNLGEITLTESANKLQEVVVTADRPLVENKADRYIVNVSGNIQSAGRDALDILRNTPGVLVDMKGSVSTMGKEVAIWIDGRPSRLSGNQLQTLLNSLKGDEIDRIEVITNPSSRYDAEGSGGIINIRTKKGLQYGLNGSINVNDQQSHVNRGNIGASLNYRNSKVNLFGNYSIGRYDLWNRMEQIRNLENNDMTTVFNSNTLTKTVSPTIRQQYRLGVDFFINSRNTVGILFNGYNNTGKEEKVSGTTSIINPLDNISSALSENFATGTNRSNQVNVNWQSNFAEGQHLAIDADYARFYSNPKQNTKNEYLGTDGALIGLPEQLRNANPNTVDLYSIKADYDQPLWKDAKLESGVKVSRSKTDNDLTYEGYIVSDWQIDARQTNRFVYTEDIYAAYFNLSQRLGKFSLQAGLRGEYTRWESEQRTTGEMNDTAYFNLFPTFFVNYQASQANNFGLSYSRRLSRPSYNALNPFEQKVDAYSYIVGNPGLTPSYTHNIELSYSFKQRLMARLAYSHTTDEIVETSISLGNGDYALTETNFGNSQNLTLMAMYRTPITKFWNIMLMVQSGYLSNKNKGYSSDGIFTQVQLNNSLTITPTLSAEVTGMYVTGAKEGYFEIKPFGSVTLALRQQLLKGKMSIGLTLNDVFNTYIMEGTAKFDQTDYQIRNYQDTRSVNLNFRYNFGSNTVKAARNRRSGIEDEIGRAK